jgi:DNA-binding NarL/FixJ family response regulator
VECGMSQDPAQKVKKLANLDNYGSPPCPSAGSSDTALSSAPGERVRSGAKSDSSAEDIWKQPGSNGQGDGSDYRLNSRGGHELVGRQPSSADARLTALGGGLADGRDVLHDARILIIDDCTLYRGNLAATFVANGAATPSVAWDLPSLVTALDGAVSSTVLLSVGTRDSLMLLQAALRISPDVRVIVLGVSEDDESTIVACAEAGVTGYHLRSESLDDLLMLLRKVTRGESVCSPKVSAILLRRLSMLAAERKPGPEELVLTAREIQILRMLEMGQSNRDIAEQLCIALHTVKNHVHSVLGKLGVSTRAEAAARIRTVRFTQAESEN